MIQFNASLIYTIINLVIFYLLLKKFLFKPVMGIMEKREKMIADEKTENQGNKGIYDQFLEGVGEAHGNTDID